jgi:hypothetical protein
VLLLLLMVVPSSGGGCLFFLGVLCCALLSRRRGGGRAGEAMGGSSLGAGGKGRINRRQTGTAGSCCRTGASGKVPLPSPAAVATRDAMASGRGSRVRGPVPGCPPCGWTN